MPGCFFSHSRKSSASAARTAFVSGDKWPSESLSTPEDGDNTDDGIDTTVGVGLGLATGLGLGFTERGLERGEELGGEYVTVECQVRVSGGDCAGVSSSSDELV